MNSLTACCSALLVGVFLLIGRQPAQSQTAEEILNKADAIYSRATTYQATYHWETKWIGKRGKVDYYESEVVKVQAVGTTKFILHAAYDKPSKQKQDDQNAALTGTWDIYDDGADHYYYTSSTNDYSHDTHDNWMEPVDSNPMLDRIIPRLKPQSGFTYSLRKPVPISGKMAYVIEVKGTVQSLQIPLPQWVTIKGHRVEQFSLKPQKKIQKIDILLYIDPGTFRLLQRNSQTIFPDFTEKSVQIMQSEVLDVPLPNSTFVFVIPNGAKKRDTTVQRVR